MRENREQETLLEGRNAVMEAFKAGRTIDKVFLAEGAADHGLRRLASLAREAGAVVTAVDRRKLDQMSPTGAHQGIVAMAAAHDYSTLDDMLALAARRGEAPLLVLCDELSDPHNLGAIIRSAECAGAHGVLVPKRRSVGLTYAVDKASAGALEHIPVARVTNLPRLLDELKERGVWVYAADMDGGPWVQADLTGPCALVIGSEGRGVGRLVKEKADFVLSLPVKGRVNSLNASVAAGVLCCEVARQRSGLQAFDPIRRDQ